jgi:hypothetical protein
MNEADPTCGENSDTDIVTGCSSGRSVLQTELRGLSRSTWRDADQHFQGSDALADPEAL